MILAMILMAATPAIGNYRTEVDGKTYRVKVKGQGVGVFGKAIITKRSPEDLVRMKQAVKSATGCDITDQYWQGAGLIGILDCTKTD